MTDILFEDVRREWLSRQWNYIHNWCYITQNDPYYEEDFSKYIVYRKFYIYRKIASIMCYFGGHYVIDDECFFCDKPFYIRPLCDEDCFSCYEEQDFEERNIRRYRDI